MGGGGTKLEPDLCKDLGEVGGGGERDKTRAITALESWLQVENFGWFAEMLVSFRLKGLGESW